ncbi:MAG: indolepyruvate ferredoxin oxidoreductase subunit alpha [Promethearchaeati archaeon]
MPWIDKEKCDGCEICIEECPADAISMIEGKAEIDMIICIRCGTCHKVCPQHAARHDSEKIPEEVEANVIWVKNLLNNYETEKERRSFIKRIQKHFQKEITVNQKTLERIKEFV